MSLPEENEKSAVADELGHEEGLLELQQSPVSWKTWLYNEVKRRLNFYRIHVLYFITLDFIGTLLIWLTPSSTPRITFIDALFSATSALTCTGLVPVYIAQYSLFDTFVIFALLILGGQVTNSLLPVLVRRHHFHKNIKRVEAELLVEERSRLYNSTTVNGDAPQDPGQETSNSDVEKTGEKKPEGSVKTLTTTEGDQLLSENTTFEDVLKHVKEVEETEVVIDERDVPGEIRSFDLRTMEYKALKTLSWLVPAYFIIIHIVAIIILLVTFWVDANQRFILDQFNVNHTYFCIFQAFSAFANCGYVLLDTSLIQFQQAVVFLLVMGSLILLGNTLYAPALRLIVYLLHSWGGPTFSEEHGLGYLLEHPRKCFTHLFPFHQTLWLTVTIIAFNAVEVFFFCVLDWNFSPINYLSGFFKIFDALIQSLNSRNSGFSIVAYSGLAHAMLFLYVGMMYVAVYPVYLSRQSSKEDKEVILRRVVSDVGPYHEKQVGVFTDEDMEFNDKAVASQARKLVGRDSVILFGCIFLIAIIQSWDLQNDTSNYSIFTILFEVVSAYGNVGLSLGYTCPPTAPASCVSPPTAFSGVWHVGAKLVIIFVMLLGRHRGLPENIDDAVQLPSIEKFRRDVIVRDTSLQFPEELTDATEHVVLVKEKENKFDLFRSISERVGGSSGLPRKRSLHKGVMKDARILSN